jgi:small G protein signaling modulator 3
MASASSPAAQATTPVHSHPLSAEDLSSRGRRTRVGQRKAETSSADTPSARTLNYFTLRDRLDASAQADSRHGNANLDGSVRGYGKVDRARTTRDSSATRQPLPTLWDQPPAFVVGSSKDHLSLNSMTRTTDLAEIDGLLPGAASRILTNRWHDYSDEAIQSAISSICPSESPASISSHPYHLALRVLSSAVHNLTKIRREMEESLRVIQQKERARRQRAEELMKELQPSERDIAGRVMQSLFTDDDEGMHKVERNQSHSVRTPQFDIFYITNKPRSPSPTHYPRQW